MKQVEKQNENDRRAKRFRRVFEGIERASVFAFLLYPCPLTIGLHLTTFAIGTVAYVSEKPEG